MITQLDRYNIEFVIASGPIQVVKSYQAVNQRRFIGGFYYSPRYTFPDTTEFIHLIKDGTIKVMGELGLQYAGLTLADSAIAPYLNICSRYNIPLHFIQDWVIQVPLTRNVAQTSELILEIRKLLKKCS